MKIYHVTSKGTEILLSGVIEPKNGQVYFCQSFSGAERMMGWWDDIKFKKDKEKEILELNVETVDYRLDPHTKSFGGCIATQPIRLTKFL